MSNKVIIGSPRKYECKYKDCGTSFGDSFISGEPPCNFYLIFEVLDKLHMFCMTHKRILAKLICNEAHIVIYSDILEDL